ncbi:aminoacyl-histidine dipeptidase [Clostridium botulinum]|nr:aminoacyl-histidine dipeptidase [Clostridium botulinum]
MYKRMDDLICNKIFRYFRDISNIPRESGNEKKISDYLFNFAKGRNLWVIQDEYLNIIIKKQATNGYEKAATIIFQAHMDMVCEKIKKKVHDFKKDPIEFKIEGDMLYAKDTTLGADDGIGLAYMLAILDSNDISHPNLEMLFTTEEETTMIGALNFNHNLFEGKVLINIDSEEEGKILVSSAGGIDIKHNIPIKSENAKENLQAFNIVVEDLKGGHSGLDIHRERGNAIKILGRILKDLSYSMEYSLAFMQGGSKTNNIPVNANAKILIEKSYEYKLKEFIKFSNNKLKEELYLKDDNINIKLKDSIDNTDKVISEKSKKLVLNSILITPNGVESMDANIEGLVESSVNLGIISVDYSKAILESGIRSSNETLKRKIVEKIKALGEITNSQIICHGDYPEWPYDEKSEVLSLSRKVFKKLYGKEAEIIAYHCGIECGVLKNKIKGLQFISIGPNIFEIHTPKEHLSISSAERTFQYILEILKEMKNF